MGWEDRGDDRAGGPDLDSVLETIVFLMGLVGAWMNSDRWVAAGSSGHTSRMAPWSTLGSSEGARRASRTGLRRQHKQPVRPISVVSLSSVIVTTVEISGIAAVIASQSRFAVFVAAASGF